MGLWGCFLSRIRGRFVLGKGSVVCGGADLLSAGDYGPIFRLGG